MNDPMKRIDVEKSSLLSLKAELLRKQEEALKNKKPVPTISLGSSSTKKIKESVVTTKVEGGKVAEVEDSALMAKSKRILEAKAKYYDKMMESRQGSSGDSLVLFSKKSQAERRFSFEDDDGMVEYTDCFGRSRRIPKKDLEKIKAQDNELSDVVESRSDQVDPSRNAPRTPESAGEVSESESGSEMIGPPVGLQFQKQREEWDKQENLNAVRPELHYRDVLFDEARTHGTAFYEFSTDHEERSKQMEALNKIRDDTLDEQQKRMDLKKSRDDVIANRVKMAKARVRARQGLPPEEEKPVETELFDATDLERKRLKDEELARQKAEIEKKKDRERKKHVRPWDKAKLTADQKVARSESSSESEEEKEWKPQREYQPMSQDEWNEKQRAERQREFAPMSFVRSDESYNPNNIIEEEKNEKSLFFSSKPKLKRRNLSPEAESSRDSTANSQRGAAIPPPATFDYYGPSSTKQTRSIPPPATLEASISAGLKFLREQVDKGNKHKWTSNSDYTNG